MNEIVLKAKHFLNTLFFWGEGGCAIEKAIREIKPDSIITESVNQVNIDGETFLHELYDLNYFYEDKEKAEVLDYSDAVIRTIKLTNDK